MSNTNNKEPNTTDDLDTMERKGLVTSENLREVIEQGRQTLGVDNWEVRFDKQFIPNDGSIPTYIENGNDLKAFIHQELQKVREEERERIEAIFKEHVPPHAMDLEDSVWLKRLLNKAFNHDKIV